MSDMELETFIEQLKKKSCARIADHSQALEDPNKDEMEIVKGLDLIQKLDLQLKEVEERQKNVTQSMSTNGQTQSLTPKKSLEQAENIVRLERTNQVRACKLRRILESLDQNQHESSAGFILRNIKLGPNSRYFMLKPEEEAIVERLLQESNLEENGSVSSSQYDMGFKMSEEDAHRLARIDDELLQYQSRHDKSGPSSASITCNDVNTPKVENGSTPTTIHSKHVRLCCKAIGDQDKMESVVGDYLNERRYCREYQLQSEAVDKKLRDLQVCDLPKLTTEEITVLLNQCRYEQGMLSDTLASHSREGHYSVQKVLVV